MSNCVGLDANTPCGSGFAGLPVFSQDFPSSANFSAAAQSQIGVPGNLADDLIAGTGCSQDAVRLAVQLGALRYQMAYFCSARVQRAVTRGCVVPTSRQGDHVLCPEQCDAATNSVRAIFANRALCPTVADGSPQARAREQVGDAFATFCSSVSRANQAAGNPCQAGVSSERCGYMEGNTSAVCRRQNATDACCRGAISGLPANATATTTAPATSGSVTASPTGAATPTGTAASAEAESGNGTLPVIPVAVALGATALGLIGLALFCVIKRRKKKAMLREAGYKSEGGAGNKGSDEKRDLPRNDDVAPPNYAAPSPYQPMPPSPPNPFADPHGGGLAPIPEGSEKGSSLGRYAPQPPNNQYNPYAAQQYPPPPVPLGVPGPNSRGTPSPHPSNGATPVQHPQDKKLNLPEIESASNFGLDQHDENQWLVGNQQSMGRDGKDGAVGAGIAMGAVGAGPAAVAGGQGSVEQHPGQGPNADLNSLLGLKHAVYDYVANMSDEIEIFVGDPILITEAFEDGWVFGRNLRSGAAGMLPLVIVETQPTPPDPQSYRNSRTTSMYRLSSLGYGTMQTSGGGGGGTLTRALGQGR